MSAARAGSLAAAGILAGSVSWAQGMATADRVQGPGWWPTKAGPGHQEYAGPSACLRCHRGHPAAQASTAMAHQGLDFTPSHALAAPRDVEEAMARVVDEAEARRCFACP